MKRLLFTITLYFFSVISAEALEIAFLKSSCVDGSVVNLGDVARFSEENDLTRALATLKVGHAPPPGEMITLRSVSIKNSLSAKRDFPRNALWKGSSLISVKRNAQTIDADRILTIIDEFLLNRSADLPEAEVKFTPNSLPLPFHLPVGGLSYEVIPSNPAILGSSRFSLIFRIDGVVKKNMSVRGKLTALANIVIAAKSIRRGQVLTAEHLTKAVTDISKIADPALHIDNYIGLRAKRRLRAGTPLRAAYVEALPVVRKGQKVKMIVSSGSLLLTATGLAQNDGAKDQVIRVQNLSSRKIIFCRVSAPGLVEVLL